MRDLSDLNINEGGVAVTRLAPSLLEVEQFVEYIGLPLPEDYLNFLLFANGGCPETDSFTYLDGHGEDAVDTFHYLNSDRTDLYGVWARTEHLKKYFRKQLLLMK